MRSRSPAWTSRDALDACPLERIRPRSQARLARVRVLKKRAAQSQISIRTPFTCFPPVPLSGCNLFNNIRLRYVQTHRNLDLGQADLALELESNQARGAQPLQIYT